jgi:predicted dinucleotide-binding enzyme
LRSQYTAKQISSNSRLVKACNTIHYEDLRTKGNPQIPIEDRFVIYVAGDDSEAKSIVSKLIEDIGFASVDTGSLKNGGRKQQPGSPIYNNPMTFGVAHKRLSEIA